MSERRRSGVFTREERSELATRAFAPHWSATLAYNYYDFGNDSALLTDNVGTRVSIVSLKDKMHAITAGVNYHF